MTIRNRLLIGGVSNCVGKFTTVGAWFFLTPFVLTKVGVDGYALWVLVAAFFSYGMLLELGIGGAVIKYVAEHVARGDREGARAIVTSALWLYLGLATIAVVIGAAAAPGLPAILGVDVTQQRIASWLIALTGLNVAVAIAIVPASAVLRGLHRYDLHNAVAVVNGVVEAVAVLAVLMAGWGLIGMLVAVIVVNVATGLATVRLVSGVAPDLRIRLREPSITSFRRIASFSSSLFVIQAGGRMQNRAAEFVIAALHSLNGVTPYALARKLAELSESLVAQFLTVLLPLASELDAGHDHPTLRRLYITTTRMALATVVPLSVILVVTGSAILRLWVGPEYAEHGALVAVLAVTVVVATSQRPATEVLQGMAQHRVAAVTSVAAGAVNILLSILLLPLFGLLGVAIGTLVPSAIAAFGVVMPFVHRRLDISLRMSLREIWAPALIPAVPAAALLWTFQRQIAAPPAPVLVAWIGATLVVYGLGYLSMPPAAAERKLIRDGITGGSRRLRRLAPGVSRFM